VAVTVSVAVAIDVCTVVWMSVSVFVTVLGATVAGSTVTVSAGAAPPVELCLSWWLPPALAAALVVAVVVVVVVVLVGGVVVPFDPHATDSIPVATATTPIVNGARRQTRAMVNPNGFSLPRKDTK
jgi:hypothetical protein